MAEDASLVFHRTVMPLGDGIEELSNSAGIGTFDAERKASRNRLEMSLLR